MDGDGLTDIWYASAEVIEEGGNWYNDHDIILLRSTPGVPEPLTEPTESGYSLTSDVDPSGHTILYPGGVGDIDADGRADLAIWVGEFLDVPQEGDYRIHTAVISGWDLPWHDPQFW